MRREYDIVNARKHANIMTIAHDFEPSTGTAESGHPFRYAHVLGIFHADIVYVQPGQEVTIHNGVEFLWVHWYQFDTSYKSGFQFRRPHRLVAMPLEDPSACGFVDPDDVIRGVHLIPGFAHGTFTDDANVPSEDVPAAPTCWKYYYTNL